jgi:hypothetical protein
MIESISINPYIFPNDLGKCDVFIMYSYTQRKVYIASCKQRAYRENTESARNISDYNTERKKGERKVGGITSIYFSRIKTERKGVMSVCIHFPLLNYFRRNKSKEKKILATDLWLFTYINRNLRILLRKSLKF